MTKKAINKNPTKLSPKLAEKFDEELAKREEALVARVIETVLDIIKPAIETTFDAQMEYVDNLMRRTIEDSYKLVLEHSIEERQEALAALADGEEAADDGDSPETIAAEAEMEGREDERTGYQQRDGN